MNIEELLNKDKRIIDLREVYKNMLSRKNHLIMEISNVEADIIKAAGAYEAISKEILATYVPPANTTDTVEPVEEPIAEENEDDGFADVLDNNIDEAEPGAETDRSNGDV